mmetsp:Transcript_29175/g.78943  ORF Transcript_29175/g.78943 Transcript_29175/m.78943 type:complete len:645 (-) Transcript_29175:408-2342(-)
MASSNPNSYHHHYPSSHARRYSEEELLPDMIGSPSGSISTSSSHEENPQSPPLFSSSQRMHERFSALNSFSKSNKNNYRRHASPISRSHRRGKSGEIPTNVSNSSILMGAEIIKRKLSADAAGNVPRYNDQYHGEASYKRHGSNDLPGTKIDRDDWDPWRTDSKDSKDSKEEGQTDNETSKNTRENHAVHHRNGNLNNTVEEDNEEDDADTVEILQFASSIIDKYKSPCSKPSPPHSRTPIPKKPEPSNATNSNPKPKSGGSRSSGSYGCLVQRVSEMEDSSLASSSTGTGYLPNTLITGLTCGGLTLGSNRSWNTGKSKETSTLDFLTKLHEEEENLNSIMSTIEEKQRTMCSSGNADLYSPYSLPKLQNVPEGPEPLRVTAAAAPFEKMVSPRSPEHDKLMKDPAFRHALKAGILWQSLCSQHVRFPANWWDGQDPVGPPLGSSRKHPRSWSYLGRHRVEGDYKLNSLIGNRGSSGRILLHLVVRDVVSGEPMEDIACGCYHPNARGIRRTRDYDPRVEDCRDVWIAHRRRIHKKVILNQDLDESNDDDDDDDDEYSRTTIESILRHQNKGRVDASPLGAQGGSSRSIVNNQNLKAVFGSKPPVYTAFCLESELYEIFQARLDGSIPASVALLRHYLRYQIG